MKMIGNEVYIQRGETWSLDFAVTNEKGHPFAVLNTWKNPYLAITVSAALYEQEGDFRETYWLDLDKRYIEQSNGSMVLGDLKKFTSTEVLWLPGGFYAADALTYYGTGAGGKIVLDTSSDFDITNFLFYTDPDSDGNYQYKYIKTYGLNPDGSLRCYKVDQNFNVVYNTDPGYDAIDVPEEEDVIWADYDFRVIKQFNTKNWMEQGYLFDIKILAGEAVQEHLMGILDAQRTDYEKQQPWSNEDWQEYINAVEDEEVRAEIQRCYDDGAPLMPTYDTKGLLLEPTPIYVSVNIQGGVR